MHYLTFELSDNDEGFATLEAMASTTQEHHAAVMAEAHEVLDWAWRHFPHSHGPIDDGMDWDHDLQVSVEAGQWHAVTVTLTGSSHFINEFLRAFGESSD